MLTASVFTIGILIGLLVNSQRTSFLEQENKMQRLDYDSIQLQYLYLVNILEKEKNCLTATKALEKQISDLGVLGGRLENFIQDNTANLNEYNLLKREYILAELRYWLFIRNIKDLCEDDSVSLLYFYSNERCNDCRTQGIILNQIKSDLKDKILIFSLDYDAVNEPLLSMIKNQYAVTDLPTLIIDDDVYPGFKNSEDLLKIICPKYKQSPDICNKKFLY